MDRLNSTFQDETFRNSSYTEEQWKNKEFENCTFINCDFTSAGFISCYFERCVFDNCNLSMARLDDSLFREVTFTRCKLLGILWNETRKRGFYLSIRYESSVLNYSVFYGLDLRKCSFEDCIAIEADFTEANLSKLNLHNMDLSGATFFHTNLKETNLTTATNYLFNPADNPVKGTTVSPPEALNLLYPFGIKVNL